MKPAHRDHGRRSRRHRARRSPRARRPIRACSTSCEPIVYAPPAGAAFAPGVLSAEAGRAAYDIDRARGRAMRSSGVVEAIATAPVNKEAFRLAGLPWTRPHRSAGAPHRRAARRDDVPLRALRVVLATMHIPLAEVPRALTQASLEATIALTARELPRFGIAAPRIAVAGLNPHAGEHGLFGREEETVDRAGDRGVPRARHRRRRARFPATRSSCAPRRGEFDVVVACYHDQGLIPVKLLAFGQAVNVTLGLPIVRTSVDHGTAFDIAGKGVADPESMIAAVLLAARLAQRSRTSTSEAVRSDV